MVFPERIGMEMGFVGIIWYMMEFISIFSSYGSLFRSDNMIFYEYLVFVFCLPPVLRKEKGMVYIISIISYDFPYKLRKHNWVLLYML